MKILKSTLCVFCVLALPTGSACLEPPAGDEIVASDGGSAGVTLMDEDFTLRVIFYGLIGFVPNSNKQGMTALLLSDCNHKSVVMTTDGTCPQENDCRIPADSPEGEFYWDLESVKNGKKLKLTLDVGDASNVYIDLYDDARHRRPFPATIGDIQDWSWVPKMKEISQDHAGYGDECLTAIKNGALDPCRVTAVFPIKKAKEAGKMGVGVCHFAHEEEYPPLKHSIFNFRSKSRRPHGSATPRAIADAVIVHIAAKGAVSIFAEPLDGSSSATVAKLQPTGDFLTLIVANSYTGMPDETDWHEHFELFYGLTYERPSDDKVFWPDSPQPFSNEVHPPACETVLSDYGKALGFLNGQHATRECDSLSYASSAVWLGN